ncbi:hypothetical protein LOTGIDRAFT_168978 [Lottia gigantea]|uniref:C-type lectin domain-containing protein n=1 Tax=Lottia gigantea TaxID=225164 RepID=V3ZHP8_LOTGI|nr:hypothetical protein LOTGIDRAFT_168978 [Lottia gigantea]ESO83737.1 hypothetical protein LOTGIDRAFT_168978 [Lottia gigantea]
MGLLLQMVYLQNNGTCVDSIYMKIQYKTKLINNYISKFLKISSAYECLEYCRNHGTCKSVGIDTSSMTCYLYNDRVYAGLNGTNNSNIIYYWLLESECPIQLGYREAPESKICSLYNDTNLTWLEAQIQCQREGGFLFMADTRANLGAFTSLGATDMYDEDVWEWFNGVPIDRSHFAPDDPNNYENTDHCLFFHTALNDYKCDILKFGFICQIPTIQTYLPSAGTV